MVDNPSRVHRVGVVRTRGRDREAGEELKVSCSPMGGNFFLLESALISLTSQKWVLVDTFPELIIPGRLFPLSHHFSTTDHIY